jgi:hypothetical protein
MTVGDLEHLHKLVHYDLNLCGCGNPEDAYVLIRDLLGLAPFYDHPQQVRDRIGGDEGAQHIVLSLMDHTGLIEHGSSIGGSWITPKGEHFLGLMRRHGYDDVEQAELPHDGADCPTDCPHAKP